VAFAQLQAHPEWAQRRPGWALWTDQEVEHAVSEAARDVGSPVRYLRTVNGAERRLDVTATLSGSPIVQKAYDRALLAGNALDYDGMERALVRAAADGRLDGIWHEVLVDEVQDVSAAQAEFVTHLRRHQNPANVTVVGDPRQSIYRFRGADPRALQRWLKLPGVTIVNLARNYRSGQAIVDAGNALARRMDLGLPDVEANHAWGEVKFLGDAEDESALVVALSKQTSPEKIAVISRTWRVLFEIEENLKRAGVPCRLMRREQSPRDEYRAERAVDAGLRLAVSPGNDVAAVDLLFALGALPSAVDEARRQASLARCPIVSVRSDLLEAVRGIGRDTEAFLAAVGLLQYAAVPLRYAGPLLDRIKGWAAVRTEFGRGVTVGDWIQYGVGDTDHEPVEKPTDAVALVTAHGAKGLEWPYAVVVGAAEGIWPSARSARNPDDINEERRLFYVACTRAERALYITWPRERSAWPGAMPEPCKPSRFVLELRDR
jgi:superfamily I DNA/RNA helicase